MFGHIAWGYFLKHLKLRPNWAVGTSNLGSWISHRIYFGCFWADPLWQPKKTYDSCLWKINICNSEISISHICLLKMFEISPSFFQARLSSTEDEQSSRYSLGGTHPFHRSVQKKWHGPWRGFRREARASAIRPLDDSSTVPWCEFSSLWCEAIVIDPKWMT